MIDQHRHWLEAAGTRVAEGVAVEISPLWALDAEGVAAGDRPQRSTADISIESKDLNRRNRDNELHMHLRSSVPPVRIRCNSKSSKSIAVDDVPALVARLAERGVTTWAADRASRTSTLPIRAATLPRRTKHCGFARSAARASSPTKGPKLDTTTKTRRELELPLDPNDADGSQFAELLAALGFTPVAVVRKRRRPFHIRQRRSATSKARSTTSTASARSSNWNCRPTMRDLDAAKRVIATLAAELDLGPSERRSYLEMLLETIAEARRELSFSPLAHFAILPPRRIG